MVSQTYEFYWDKITYKIQTQEEYDLEFYNLEKKIKNGNIKVNIVIKFYLWVKDTIVIIIAVTHGVGMIEKRKNIWKT